MPSLEVNPNTTLIVDMSRVIGGKTTTSEVIRNEREGDRHEIERHSETIVEDVNERAFAEKLRNAAHHIIRKVSVLTMIGPLADRDRVPQIESDLEEIKAKVDEFNAGARTCKVTIGHLAIPISVALGPEAAKALADHVRDELTSLRDMLKAGDMPKARAGLLRTKNLGALAVGMQRDAITFALEGASDAYNALKAKSKDQGGLAETPESVGRTLDVSQIENAIALFTY